MKSESESSHESTPGTLEASGPDLTIVAIIPARLNSNRLPGKVLRPIAGEPMLGWVFRAAAACPQLSAVWIATDSEEVQSYAQGNGWPVLMTSPDLASGTDRVRAAAAVVNADLYVNVQGDEPLLLPSHIDGLVRPFRCAPDGVDVTTLSTPCSPAGIHDPNTVKVVTGRDGRALYFSRLPIPYCRDGVVPDGLYRKHLGLYAYRRSALERFSGLPPGQLEVAERLEQLRMLENGMRIQVEPTEFDTIGVDTEEDLQAVERILSQRAGTVGSRIPAGTPFPKGAKSAKMKAWLR